MAWTATARLRWSALSSRHSAPTRSYTACMLRRSAKNKPEWKMAGGAEAASRAEEDLIRVEADRFQAVADRFRAEDGGAVRIALRVRTSLMGRRFCSGLRARPAGGSLGF